MGAPNKNGLDYFQVDMGLYEDDKVLLAQEYIDPDGSDPWMRFTVPHMAVRMLREILKDGYYIEWDDRVALSRSSKMDSVITMSCLKKIINVLIDSGFFNKDLYLKFNILTSHGIQLRWYKICKMAKRKNVKIEKDHCLLSDSELSYTHLKKNQSGFTPEQTQKTHEVTPSYGEETPQINYSINSNSKSIDIKGKKKKNKVISNINTNNEENSGTNEENSGTNEENSGTNEENSGTNEENSGTNEENSGTNEEIGLFDGKWNLLIPVSICKYFYFKNNIFANPREGALKVLSNYYFPPIDLSQGEQMQEMIDRLILWADEYNDHLGRIEEKDKNGRALKNMQGPNCWPNHFHNWLRKQGNRLSKKPDGRIDNQSDISHNGNGSLISGSDTIQAQEDFYKRKT